MIQQHYVHCPECGKYDRHFVENLESKTYCSKCGFVAPINHFHKPEVSDRWIPQVKRDEICVIQMKDLHGRLSLGWFSETKVLIAKAGSKEPSPIFDALVAIAVEEANRRNAAQ